MDKVRVIERSLNCFIAGCLGLIPLLGILPAIVAISLHHKVLGEVRGNWNPARAQLIAGCVLAWAGLSINIVGLFARLTKIAS